eukprot:scaffold2090_cov225-Prasinococcus_capsulatus_cf.AAC.18
MTTATSLSQARAQQRGRLALCGHEWGTYVLGMEENAPGNVRPVVATLVGGQHAHALEQQVAQQRDLHLAAVGVVLQLPNAHLPPHTASASRNWTCICHCNAPAWGRRQTNTPGVDWPARVLFAAGSS